MKSTLSKQRIYAFLLMLGACVLIFRTVMMFSQGALGYLVWWVGVALIIEFLIDVACLLTAARWWIADDKDYDSLPLRLGAAAAIFHAFRVLIFILGRTGPWVNFDVRPEYIATHAQRWTWGGVVFAGVMSVLGIFGVIVIWKLRKRARNQ